jgi:predicted kinase
MKTAIIMRGIPGSGKSTVAAMLRADGVICSTDEFWTQPDGSYLFDKDRLQEAHQDTLRRFRDALKAGKSPVICDNTNVRRRYFADYIAAAEGAGYRVHVVHVEADSVAMAAERNSHNVKPETVARMAATWEKHISDAASWIDHAERQVSDGLVRLANQGSVPAANAVLKLLAEEREREAAELHVGRLDELHDEPIALARYLGEAGMSKHEAQVITGEQLTDEQLEALIAGRHARKAEIRHVELQRVRSGGGKIEPWMRQASDS